MGDLWVRGCHHAGAVGAGHWGRGLLCVGLSVGLGRHVYPGQGQRSGSLAQFIDVCGLRRECAEKKATVLRADVEMWLLSKMVQ